MKKTVLGKITFILVCVITIAYIFAKAHAAWYTGDRYNGWGNLFEMTNSAAAYATVRLISEYFALPIMWSVLCVAYVIVIGCNKRTNRLLYAGTALAILADTIFYAIRAVRFEYEGISLAPLLIRIGFFLSLIILSIGITKGWLSHILYSVLGCTYVGTLVYIIVTYRKSFVDIIHELSRYSGTIGVYGYVEYLLIPILGFIVCTLIIGYILFPDKYIKES